MKRLNLFFFCLLTMIALAGNAQEKQADANGYIVKVGEQAPDFTVKFTDGQSVKLSSLRGKEMPFIEKDIWQKHKDNKNFYLMGIDRDEPLEKVIAFGKATKVTYPLALDPGADVFALYAQRQAGITRNVLIDRDGKIVMLTRLYNPEEFQRLVEKIDEMLAEE